MNVLHVLNAAGGGASVGALEFMRWSREAGAPEKHFAVHPGDGPADPVVSAVSEASAAIPMRWWNRKNVDPLRRAMIKVRDMQVTRGDRITIDRLTELCSRWSIDLIHTNTAATRVGADVAAVLEIPHVWHIRERIGRTGFMRFGMPDDRLISAIADLSSSIVPMSHFTAEPFLEHGQAAKTQVVHDGVDPVMFGSTDAKARGEQLRRSWGIGDDEVVILKAAAVTSTVKRHATFIRAAGIAARRSSSVRFVIAGALPGKQSWMRRTAEIYYSELRALAAREGLADRLLWTGDVADSAALMNSCDVLAHACEIEGFGRVAIEAMAAGKPVIGPSAGGIAESVADGRTGIMFTPGDVEGFAAALLDLSGDAGLRRELGLAGRERAETEFSPGKHLAVMSAIFSTAWRSASPSP